MTTDTAVKATSRNEPCPCGSGKKFKRCHGVEAPPNLGHSQNVTSEGESATTGFDPSQIDQAWLAQFSSAMQQLPKGQLQRFQAIARKAMQGKDVTKELEEFQKTLPASMQTALNSAPEVDDKNAESLIAKPAEKKSFFSRLFKKSS